MRRSIIFVAVLAAFAAPSAALASGVVLKVKPSARIVAVATSRTHVALVHSAAASRLHVGQRVAVTGRMLGNGTLRASRVRVVGKAHTVRFRGLLLSKSSTRFVVSAGGAVITLHRGARNTSSARDSAPHAGAQVDVTATVQGRRRARRGHGHSRRPDRARRGRRRKADARHRHGHRALRAPQPLVEGAGRVRPDGVQDGRRGAGRVLAGGRRLADIDPSLDSRRRRGHRRRRP